MSHVLLTGLDGSSPLAFMAALGALRVLDDQARAAQLPAPRLSWGEGSPYAPSLHGPESMADIIAAIAEDLSRWPGEPAFEFAYDKKTGKVVSGGGGKTVRDLKALPSRMRAFLDKVALRAANGDDRSARQAAAYASDLVTDNNDRTKPTAFHFAAGQQSFLGAMAEIHQAVSNNIEEDLREALVGPWTRTRSVKSLGWDPMGAFSARMYALRATNPSKDPRPGIPGAEWLAFVGLSFFPVVARKRAGGKNRLHTTCVQGGWKDSVFSWPLWSPPLTADTVASLLVTFRPPIGGSHARVCSAEAERRRARGISAVFAANILRSDQGGYGAFSPSSYI